MRTRVAMGIGLAFLFLGLVISSPAIADVGVGVTTVKMVIDEALKPGEIYKFPSITVINTGDETGEYEMRVSYRENQPERKPEADWFSFSPKTFSIDGNGSQMVEVSLNLPLKAAPGDYFAFIDATLVPSPARGVMVSMAAGTKVYFSVLPANIWVAITYRASSFLSTNAPISWYVLYGIAGIIVILLIWRFSPIRVRLARRP